MKVASQNFKEKAHTAIENDQLQHALIKLKNSFADGRTEAVSKIPEFDAIRDRGRDMKNHTLQHLDTYLEMFEKNVLKYGGKVHWARNAKEANDIIAGICNEVKAKKVTKSKSMLSEEIALNERLEAEGIETIETDLGEYILQMRHEHPGHVVLPAIHILKEQVVEDFKKYHTMLDKHRELSKPEEILLEARNVLRKKFIETDLGITGANALIAETGTVMMVTNEGNADLVQTLPDNQIVVAGIEKIVPTFKEAATQVRLLARSATGQEITAYTSFTTGPKRKNDTCGPSNFHVVLVDNGRTEMLGTKYQEMLRCIRCGACMNNCPVYDSVGGQTYGWVYPGPMGAVLTPRLAGLKNTYTLPNASTSCGRCAEVCPVRIPLPDLMHGLKEEAFEQKLGSWQVRFSIKAWAFIATRPRLYRWFTNRAVTLLHKAGGKKGYIKSAPMAKGWTNYRHLPAPAKQSFQSLWKQRQKALK